MLLCLRWVSLARGDHSCDVCGKSFSLRAHLKIHIKQEHEVRHCCSIFFLSIKQVLNSFPQIQSETERDKSQGHLVVYHSLEVKNI